VRLARVAGPDGLARLAATGPDGAVIDLALAARRRLERRGATAEAAARLAAAAAALRSAANRYAATDESAGRRLLREA
jgi:hypothetical protein